MSDSVVTSLGICLFTVACWYLFNALYTTYLGPLAHIPGPKLWAASKIPSQRSILRGRSHLDMLKMQAKYGDVVRIGPDEVACFNYESFRDIYTSRQGRPPFAKDRKHYICPPNGVDNLVTAIDEATHARHRRLLGYAFSEKALREQEPLIQSYVTLLISRLRDQVRGSSMGKVDIKSYFNFTTFDIMGDIMFGEPFGCLKESTLHPWISMLFDSLKAMCYISAVNQFPGLSALLERLIPKSALKQQLDHFNLAAEKVNRRLELKAERPDVISFAFRNGMREGDATSTSEGERTMSRAEMHSNAQIMIIAGSETSATALSGCIYLLCTHPKYLDRMTSDIRTAFSSSDDITMSAITKLDFLSAIIEESLRLYPPFVTGLSRVTPKGGDIVAGIYVPEDTIIASHYYASFRSPSNFTSPSSFLPERWLNTDNPSDFRADKREAFQPFSLGPRGCLGKSLAYAEIRLILTKLLWNFDVELCAESKDWVDQDVFFLWDKPALMVKLTEREVSGIVNEQQ